MEQHDRNGLQFCEYQMSWFLWQREGPSFPGLLTSELWELVLHLWPTPLVTHQLGHQQGDVVHLGGGKRDRGGALGGRRREEGQEERERGSKWDWCTATMHSFWSNLLQHHQLQCINNRPSPTVQGATTPISLCLRQYKGYTTVVHQLAPNEGHVEQASPS